MPTKTKIKIAFGVAINAAVIYYSVKVLRGLGTGAIMHEHINWSFMAASVIVYIFANYIRGLAFTRGIDRNIDRLTAFEIVGIGHALNMVLPLHAGEGLRAVFFPKDYSAVRRTNLLLIAAAADFIAIMIISVLSVPFAGFRNSVLLKALWLLCFICVAAAAAFAAAVIFIKKIREYVREYLNAGTLKMMVWVVLSWILLLLSTWLGIMGMNFFGLFSVRMALTVFAATNIINFIPASPGAIGFFEYSTVLGLSGLGMDSARALAVSLPLHLIQYISLLPLGAVLYALALHGKYGDAVRSVIHKNKK